MKQLRKGKGKVKDTKRQSRRWGRNEGIRKMADCPGPTWGSTH